MLVRIKQLSLALLPFVLFSAWPFINFLNQNRMDSAYYGDIVTYWLASTVIILIVIGALSALFRKQPLHRIAGTVAILVALIFNFLTIADLLAGVGIELRRTQLIIWLLIFLASGSLVWWLLRNRNMVIVLIAAAAAMIIIPLAQFTVFYATSMTSEIDIAVTDGATATPANDQVANRPNIYWFLLDAYMRADKLQSSLNLDTSDFLNYLRGRNFFVADESYSNYPGTYISLSSTFNMKYWVTETNNGFDRDAYSFFGSNSASATRLRGMGYSYIHGEPSATKFTRCNGGEETCIRGQNKGLIPVSDVEVTSLKMTPIFYLQQRMWPGMIAFSQLEVADVMETLKSNDLKPFFLFAHVLSPHPPPRYLPNCRPRANWSMDLVSKGGDKAKSWYAADVQCLNSQMKAALDHILATDKSDPIIILQGDHGFLFGDPGIAPFSEWSAEHIEQSLAILNAIRLPKACRKHLYPKISPVNTFRLILACIEGRKPDLLPDQSYLAGWSKRQLIRVLDKK
jgi:hypothetical protein